MRTSNSSESQQRMKELACLGKAGSTKTRMSRKPARGGDRSEQVCGKAARRGNGRDEGAGMSPGLYLKENVPQSKECKEGQLKERDRNTTHLQK